VEPQFYITESSFSYGSEITGPEYLGKPVDGLTLGPDQQFQFNIRLNARSQALQSMIRGLAYFSIRDYDSAADEFQSAVNTPYWEPDEGQEVAYFLLGTVRLRAWDLIQNPEALPLASAAFEKARQINPNYVRNYLSLGAVAIARAQVPNKAGNGIGAVNKEDLLEGISWYSAGLNQTEPAQAYIPVKAAFGLGQAYLLGFEFKVIDNSQEQAAQYFQQVVTAYQNEKMPQDLDWFAAHAHAGLGRLAALNQDWETMSNEYRQAAAILEGMESNPPQLWIARFQAMAGFAEMKQNHLDRARQYYSNAIKTGSGTVSEADLKSWQDALDQIEKEEP
jgi:tetratricopeptide (TPR) repeat protein